ncbi:centrosomal protein of 41 kDa [Aplysia californica]|uniref:Centrosomal protein of 41 kDa n=1 Tax=Aplysia californica TaxID=6500 RepID=A0ABM0JII5_APLCA|nr:centrosomal protein of 41 kDa [Aplysia californica]
MSARGKKSTNPLEKKIPENPKYKHVRATVDTGASVSKYMEKMEELKRDYNFRKDEIFKRMKIPTFVQLVVQVSEFEDVAEETSYPTGASDRPDTADDEVARIQKGGQANGAGSEDTSRLSPEMDTSRSRLEQVIKGTGEIDLDTPKPPKLPPMMGENCPYLLLDVRDRDAFEECHIITAKNYPTAMLARSVNYETKDMLRYKNQPGKIILVYDEDERISHRASTTLVERGYDNLFMLSGGLKVAYKLFPDGLVTGTIPAAILEDMGQGQKGGKGKDARETTPRVPADIEYFTPDLIDKLCIHLDGALSDRSTGSRLSKASRAGRSSSISSSVSSFGRKPFKC